MTSDRFYMTAVKDAVRNVPQDGVLEISGVSRQLALLICLPFSGIHTNSPFSWIRYSLVPRVPTDPVSTGLGSTLDAQYVALHTFSPS